MSPNVVIRSIQLGLLAFALSLPAIAIDAPVVAHSPNAANRDVVNALADASLIGLFADSHEAVPPLPTGSEQRGSATLMMLCALGSAGLFQVGWSARSWKLGSIPDWYAEYAPDQIGRTLRYLPGQALETGYPWQFDMMVEAAARLAPSAFSLEFKPCSRFVVEVDAPRGPPVA